jgi:hypothetical protein
MGPFSDAAPDKCQELRFMVSDDPALKGAFKTSRIDIDRGQSAVSAKSPCPDPAA